MNTLKKICPLKTSAILSNEQGYVTIVTVLGILLLLTVVSLSMVSTSINDQQIVRNDKLTKRAFYLAESGANEAAQELENTVTTDTDPTGSLTWVQNLTSAVDFANKDNWRDPNTGYSWLPVSIPSGNFINSNMQIFDNAGPHQDDVHLAAKFEGVAGGSSLVSTTTTGRLYAYYTLGMFSSQVNWLGEALIEEGYRKRF